MGGTNEGTANAAQPQAGADAASTPVPNPLASGLNLTISVPDDIEIKVVDASALDDYEVWVLIASLVMNAVVGFTVAFVQDTEASHLLWVALMFGALFFIFAWSAVSKRRKFRRKTKSYRFTGSGLEEITK